MTNKYNARKVEIDGHTFDSQKEATRYCELKLLQDAGIISDLELQPVFELQPKFKRGKITYRAIKYIADFRYKDENGNVIVEDSKGYKTAIFRIKEKMLLYKYPDIDFRIT